MKKQKANKDTLIAFLPNKKDFSIALEDNWYRIPVKTSPIIVRDSSVKRIAFYLPKIFDVDAFAIRWYGIVDNIRTVKRKELFPKEPVNEKSEKDYYRIEIDKLLRLPKAIISRRHRRILFISTSQNHFENANEINDLFYGSPIEEKFWAALKNESIDAEREFDVKVDDKKKYFIDFAVFCKSIMLGIECDGDTYHLKKEDVHYDKHRDNYLKSKGWSMLRYTTNDIEYKLDKSMAQVKETVNRYGGLVDSGSPFGNRYLNTDKSSQNSLFG